MNIKRVFTRISVLALVLTGLTAPAVQAGDRVMKQDHRGSVRHTTKRYGDLDGGGDRHVSRLNRHDTGYRRHFRRHGGHYRGHRYRRSYYGHSHGYYGHRRHHYRRHYYGHRTHLGVVVGQPGFYIRVSR